MIGSPDLFRAWRDVGSSGLDEVERYARLELRDGSWAWLRATASPSAVREPTVLRRLASALHLIPARSGAPVASTGAGLRTETAAVHFVEEAVTGETACARAADGAALLVCAANDWEGCEAESHHV